MCTHARIAPVALATLAALALTAAIAAAGAYAGEYHVYSCRTPGGQVAPTGGWSEGVHSIHDATVNTCDEGGGLIAGLQDGYSHAADSETDKATWAFEAPTNETISAATLWRAGDTAGGSTAKASYLFWISGVAATGLEAQTFDECAASNGCSARGNLASPLAVENRLVVPPSALNSPFLALNTYCGAKLVSEALCPEGKNDPAGYAATIELFAADLTLSDTEAPTISAVKGALAEAASVSGASDLEFHVSDGGAGVYEVVVKVDGKVVSSTIPDEAGGHCRDLGGTSDGLPAFLYTQPCPPAASVDLPLDTTAIANGSHHLLVSALDAAGNATPVVDRQVTVANASTQNGGGGETSGGGTGPGGAGTGGAGAGGNNANAASAGSTTGLGSLAALGQPNGTGASTQALLTAAWHGHSGERLTVRYGAARTVEGRLTGPAGAPIAGAQITVEELPAFAGAKPRPLPTPRTAADGRWHLTLPRSISSGALRFSYRAHVGDPLPVTTRTLALTVRAGVALRVAPRVARSGGSIRFSGRLLGGPVPRGGKQVVLEARSPGGRWLEFHVIRGRAGAGGRFGFAYRFRLPGPARYEFRALCEAEADYPFAAGTSNVVRVVER